MSLILFTYHLPSFSPPFITQLLSYRLPLIFSLFQLLFTYPLSSNILPFLHLIYLPPFFLILYLLFIIYIAPFLSFSFFFKFYLSTVFSFNFSLFLMLFTYTPPPFPYCKLNTFYFWGKILPVPTT